MISKKRLLVFTACYNEKENIQKLIYKIEEYLPESSILIIDDNSPDKTKDIINNLKKDISFFNLIVREKIRLGYSTQNGMLMQLTTIMTI